MVDAGVVPAVERDHRLDDALADQGRVGVRVADTVSVDHDDVGGAGVVADLLGERLDQPAVGRAAADQRLADRRHRRERPGDGQRPLLVVVLEHGPLTERDEDEADQRAGEQDPDHAGQDPGRQLAPVPHLEGSLDGRVYASRA